MAPVVALYAGKPEMLEKVEEIIRVTQNSDTCDRDIGCCKFGEISRSFQFPRLSETQAKEKIYNSLAPLIRLCMTPWLTDFPTQEKNYQANLSKAFPFCYLVPSQVEREIYNQNSLYFHHSNNFRLLEYYILHGTDEKALDSVIEQLMDKNRMNPQDLDRAVVGHLQQVKANLMKSQKEAIPAVFTNT